MMRILSLALAAVLTAHAGAEVLTRADSGLKAADGDFTASFTFRWNGYAPIPKDMAWRNGMIACHRSGYYEGWRLFLHDVNEGRPVFEVGRKEGAVSVESGEGLSTGVWHRVAVSWQGSKKDPSRGTMRLFADGMLVAESPDDRPKPQTDASPVLLGYVDFGVGALDLEVAASTLVPKALSEAEVREEYRKDPRVAADRPLEGRPLLTGVYTRSLRQVERAASRLAAEPKREEPFASREERVCERTEDLSVPAGEVRTIENTVFRGVFQKIPRESFGPVTDPAVRARLPESVRDRVLCAPVSGFDPFASYGTGISRRRAALVLERKGTPLPQAAWPDGACAQADFKDGAWSFASDAAPRLAPGTKLLAYGYWKYFWADAALPVEVQADGRYRTLEPHNYGFAENPRLKVLGVPEVLDRPGEWCVVGDRLYILPPDEDFGGISIPQFRGPFFRAHGQKGRIVFRNVTFIGSLDTALELADCADVELDHVTFLDNSGDDAVIRNCAKTRVIGSRFEQTGLTQLQVSGGDRRTLASGDVIVRDCTFARSGLLQRTYTPCIRLEGCGGLVSGCTFTDTPSSAIRLEGNDHVVMDCLFERNVLESDDQGAIDIWGDPTYRANVFFRNEFRDVGGDANHDCGRNGIRFDDFISGNGVISNLFVNAAQGNFGAVNTHGGHYNAIVGNVFRDCARGVGGFGWGDERMARRLAEDEIKAKLKVLEGDSPYRARYPELVRLGKDDGAQLVLDNIFERTPRRTSGQKLGSLVRHDLRSAPVRAHGARLGEWTQDVDAARALAAKEGKHLFMNFTGSDWCGWCKLMDEHVFSQPGWQSFARDNLALAFVDFPREKARVPEEYRARNRALQKEYGVKGYPTFVVCAPDGHVAGRLGAVRSGNEYNFVTNVVAVFVEDAIEKLVTPAELADYREAQREKAAWEADNAKLEADFRRDFLAPHDEAVKAEEQLQDGILRKAVEAFRARTVPNPLARDAEIVFADAGRGVMTNGACFGRWTADFDAASALAKRSGKDLLVAFVGPGWCKWGDEMERDVFNTTEWMNFAKEHFVLVYIDCPDEKGESRLPEWLLDRNAALYKRYRLPGCPYFLLTEADGTRYDAFGATTGITPKEQIAAVETLLARRRIRELVTPEDLAAYEASNARRAALAAQWAKDYDAFIAETDKLVERFKPIAEKRNRIFEKALKAHLMKE